MIGKGGGDRKGRGKRKGLPQTPRLFALFCLGVAPQKNGPWSFPPTRWWVCCVGGEWSKKVRVTVVGGVF